MKKLTALVLAALMCLTVFAFASCSDPLKAKGEELAKVKNEMGDVYWAAINWASFAGVYGSEDEEYAAINEQFANWKDYLKNAKDVVDTWLDLDEEQMNSYIDEWKAESAKMQEIVDQYKVETDEDIAAALAAED